MSMYTFLLIALNGDGIRATSYEMKGGGWMPVIEHLHRGETWWHLVTWDKMRLEREAATAHAQRCIDWVRKEAPKRGIEVP